MFDSAPGHKEKGDMDSLRTSRLRGVRLLDDQVAAWRTEIANPKRRTPLGWKALDDMVRGPAPGEVFTVIAASHAGKSMLATNVMSHNPNEHIIFFSLEMPDHQVLHRLTAHVFNLNARDLEDLEQKRQLPDLVDELPNRLPYQVVVDDSALGLEDMSAYMADYHEMFAVRPKLVIIDYLEEVGGGQASGEGWTRAEATASAVKAWAKDEKVGVLMLHQTNRSVPVWEPPDRNSAKGSGYAQPLDEPILTPSGWTTMGELSVGDMVVGPDGAPTKVMGVFPLGRQEVYRVSFRDGGSTRATAEHLWQVTDDNGTQRVLPTWQLNPRKGGHRVPTVSPMPGTLQALPIDPYVLGAILGDGSFRPKTTPIWDFTGEVVKCIRKSGYRVSGRGHRGRYSIPGILHHVRSLGLMGKKSRDKFVPEMYLRATMRQRLSLLRGLMDTDGTSGKNPGFATNSPHLRDAVVELVRSLGGLARVSNKKADSGPAWEVRIYDLPFNPFRIPSKVDKWDPSTNAYPRRVVAVEPEGVEGVQCISVGRPDGLYVTKDYIVTHNTQADVIIGVWRPGWDPDLPESLRSEREHWLAMNVLKNRVRGLRNEEGWLFRVDAAMRIVPLDLRQQSTVMNEYLADVVELNR
jgi:hypothetical protein